MNSKKPNKKAFTLAEMMVVLLVLSIITAAFLPVVTKRLKKWSLTESVADIWQRVPGTLASPQIFYGHDGPKKAVIIGTDSLQSQNTRLLLAAEQTSPRVQNILLTKNGANAGCLGCSVSGGGWLGSGDYGSCANRTISIGRNLLPPFGFPNASVWDVIAGYQDYLFFNFSGLSNITAVGSSAGTFNAVCDGSTLIGSSACKLNQRIDSTIAVGKFALAKAQKTIATVAIGFEVLKDTVYSEGNIAIGYGALEKFNNTLLIFDDLYGGGNVAVGSHACSSVVNGTFNICLGDKSDVAAASKYSTALGAGASAAGDYSTAIGAGASAPLPKTIVLGTPAQKVIIPSGQLSIGNSQEGALSANNGLLSFTSDLRLKTIDGKFQGGLQQLRKLQTYKFSFKSDKKNTPQVAIMAQDLQEVFPNSVTKGLGDYLMVRKEEMFYAMLNSIKQLDKTVKSLTDQSQELATRIQALDDKIVAMVKVDKVHFKKINNLESSNKSIERSLAILERSKKKS